MYFCLLGSVIKKDVIILGLLVISALLWSLWNAPCRAMDISGILERVHQRYAGGDFEADFVQEAYLKAMDMTDTARGHLCFGSPGMMRWHYEAPEEYFIISDGTSVWLYRPADRQVMTQRVTLIK